MIFRRRISIGLRCAGLVGLVALLPGCSPHGATITGKRTIAILTPDNANPFNSELYEGAAAEAKLVGWNAIIHMAPRGDASDEDLAKLAIEAIAQKPDAISVCGMSNVALQSIVQKANAADIPIFVHNQITAVPGKVEAYIGYDEYAAGRMCGDYAVTLLRHGNNSADPVGKVAIIDGAPGEHSDQRTKGFKEAFQYYSKVQLVEEKSANWDKSNAKSITEEMLNHNPDLDVLFACSDSMAMGSLKGVYTAGLSKSRNFAVKVIGFGGSNEALYSVRGNDMAATLATEPRKMGARIIHVMMDYFGQNNTVHVGQVEATDIAVADTSNVSKIMGGFASSDTPK